MEIFEILLHGYLGWGVCDSRQAGGINHLGRGERLPAPGVASLSASVKPAPAHSHTQLSPTHCTPRHITHPSPAHIHIHVHIPLPSLTHPTQAGSLTHTQGHAFTRADRHTHLSPPGRCFPLSHTHTHTQACAHTLKVTWSPAFSVHPSLIRLAQE